MFAGLSRSMTSSRAFKLFIPLCIIINAILLAVGADHPEKDYPEISRKATKGSFPMPRATKASLGKNVKNAKKSSKKDLSHFKMKKFENIPGKVHNQ